MNRLSTTKRASEMGALTAHISAREQGVCFAYMKGGIDEVTGA
jgi:hypothetical protein